MVSDNRSLQLPVRCGTAGTYADGEGRADATDEVECSCTYQSPFYRDVDVMRAHQS